MAKPSVVTKQTDFSAGEVDASLKRADDNPIFKRGGRQMPNWRILNPGGLTNRPGRRVLFLDGPRVDEVLMSPGNTFYLVFGNTYLRVYNNAGAKVFDSGNVMPWTTATAAQVVWDIYKLSIYMTFAGMQPRVLTWDGVSQTSAWVLSLYAVDLGQNNSKRSVFYRISPAGVTMLPSTPTAAGSNITLAFSSGVMTPSRVGTIIRSIYSQILITGYVNPFLVNGTVLQTLRSATQLTATLSAPFNIGDEVIGQVSGSKGIVTSYQTANIFIVQRIVPTDFIAGENVVGANGSVNISGIAPFPPQTTVLWDEEAMNGLQGWPASCFVDQGRLGFCDFPAVPGLIVWSAFGNFTDLYTDVNNVAPDNAIQELVPGKSRVRYVVPGVEASEFVFCDNAIYYIPITQSAPLKPGSVAFNQITSDGVGAVKPQRAQQSIIFVDVSGTQVKAVQAVGAYSRAYVIEDISTLHAHLLNSPIAIAVPGSSSQFEERYFYVLNGDGTIAVCKYSFKGGLVDSATLGWLPWSGGGTAKWIAALNSDVLITGTYAPNGIAAVNVVELLDAAKYLDAAMLYNVVPTALTPPVGKGPLWWIPGGTVDLMDGPLGTRMMGTYVIDADGFLIPQNNAGEDFTSVNLLVGQTWTATLEPFVPAVKEGQDIGQRMWPRRLKRVQVYVQNSTGFLMARLFSGPVTRLSPPVGTIMAQRRITTWNQDDDPTQPPPLREQSYHDHPLGYSYDPRWAFIKDTPGPQIVLELDTEVTV